MTGHQPPKPLRSRKEAELAAERRYFGALMDETAERLKHEVARERVAEEFRPGPWPERRSLRRRGVVERVLDVLILAVAETIRGAEFALDAMFGSTLGSAKWAWMVTWRALFVLWGVGIGGWDGAVVATVVVGVITGLSVIIAMEDRSLRPKPRAEMWTPERRREWHRRMDELLVALEELRCIDAGVVDCRNPFCPIHSETTPWSLRRDDLSVAELERLCAETREARR